MASDDEKIDISTVEADNRAPLYRRLAWYLAARIVPLENRHVNWLRDADIAYFRIGKAANSSIRTALAHSFGLSSPIGLRPSQNAFWFQQKRVSTLTPAAFALHPGARKAWSFSFVRHPVTRLYSCWNNKVVENPELSPSFLRMGIEPGMNFDAFVARVAAVPDRLADLHVRSQTSILTWRGKLVPDFVGRVEHVAEDWDKVRQTVAARTGVDMGELLRRNVRLNAGLEVIDEVSPVSLDLIRRRFADDYRNFYSEG